MKSIYNWQKGTVADIEADGLLDAVTKIHVLSCQLSSGKKYSIKGGDHTKLKQFIQWHINNEIPVVGHNFITFDVPVLEKILGIDCSNLMVIDTLYLSWYLNHDREQHGLDSFFEDYGFAKPKIDDWENLSYEEYKHRCESDIDINKALWVDLQNRLIDMYSQAKECIDNGEADNSRISKEEILHIDSLKGLSVEEHINRFLTFLMSKADKARLRSDTRILVDQQLLIETEKELEEKLTLAKEQLEAVMPPVPVYVKKNKPKKPFKKDGSLSASGESWNEALEGLNKKDNLGNYLTIEIAGDDSCVKVLSKYNPPNINSSSQIKDWLFSKGWKPATFKFVKDEDAQQAWVDSGFKKELKPKPRAIPQLSVDGEEGKELCSSVLKLAKNIPEIEAYSGYTLLKHRYDFIKGFKESMTDDGYVRAEVGGLTNTLREQHRRPICNMPSVAKPYGKNIRGLLTTKEGQIMLGSDLSSLEDRVKNHFCMAHDPEYLKTISTEGYDPHVYMCYVAGMITEEDMKEWFSGKKLPHVKAVRGKGKTSNYALVYGSGAETLARSGDMSLDEARNLHKAYWEVHSYVKSISDEQCLIQCERRHNWLINPINGFCYSVRTEKDIFSTLIQGTGSYFFDVWVDNIVEDIKSRWGRSVLTLLMHDELAFPFKDSETLRGSMEYIVKNSIYKVNKQFKLRVDLDCDVQFGKSYAEIH